MKEIILLEDQPERKNPRLTKVSLSCQQNPWFPPSQFCTIQGEQKEANHEQSADADYTDDAYFSDLLPKNTFCDRTGATLKNSRTGSFLYFRLFLTAAAIASLSI